MLSSVLCILYCGCSWNLNYHLETFAEPLLDNLLCDGLCLASHGAVQTIQGRHRDTQLHKPLRLSVSGWQLRSWSWSTSKIFLDRLVSCFTSSECWCGQHGTAWPGASPHQATSLLLVTRMTRLLQISSLLRKQSLTKTSMTITVTLNKECHFTKEMRPARANA